MAGKKNTIPTVYTKDVIKQVSEILKIPVKTSNADLSATTIVEIVVDTIVTNLLKGNKVNLSNFAIIHLKDIPEKEVRNPADGSKKLKPAHRKFTARPTKPMKARIN